MATSQILTQGDTWRQQQSTITAGLQRGTVERLWNGLREDMDSLVDILGLSDSGLDWSLRPTQGPCAELRVVYPTGASGQLLKPTDILTTDWQLQTHVAMVPKTQHPKAIAALRELAAYPDSEREFSQIYAGQKSYENRSSAYRTTVESLLSAKSATVLLKLLTDKWRGEENIYQGEPCLIISDRFTGAAPWGVDTANVNFVYTKARLVRGLKARKTNRLPLHIEKKLRDGAWLCEAVDVSASSDGSRTNSQTFRWAPAWDDFWYTYTT